jgi:hypothetical protein
MRIIRIGAIWGAALGIGIAVLMISLDELGPFSVPVNGFVERATFRLCPLFILGFSTYVKSNASLYLVTIGGNAVLYGTLFAVIGLGVALFRRLAARNHSE